MKILIVDDNRELAISIQDILQENGYSASVLFDGNSAVELCRKEQFDLALLDYKLPDIDGLELQERLSKRMDADYIIITAHGSVDSAARAVQRKQIVGYETKPLDFGRLLAFINQTAGRRSAEQKFRKQAEFLETVIESLTLPFYIIDVFSHKVVMANSAANFGNLSEFSTCHNLTHRSNTPCNENGIICPMVKMKKTGQPVVVEHMHYDKDGDIKHFEIHAFPIFDDRGELTRMIEYSHDITDRKLKEEKLRKAMETAESAARAKSEFLANMSHEIRTPLNVIIGTSRLMQETNLTGSQPEYTDMIFQSSEILTSLIEDILDFSKIEAGKTELESVNFNPEDLISKTADMLKVNALEKGLTLTYSVSRKIPGILKGDPNRLRQIILNLGNNAIKFTKEGNIKIQFSLKSEKENSIIMEGAVTDTGIGISKKDHSNLFKPFSQVDASTTRKYGGTGLGLIISKRLVELMGGEISVESELEKCTTFRFTACLKKHAKISDKDKEQNSEASIFKALLAKASVLLVEDNLFNQKMASVIMSTWGVSVDTAVNGKDAVELLGKNEYDIVLMDIHMPIMDGIEATRVIRNSATDVLNPDVPIIAITANATTPWYKKKLLGLAESLWENRYLLFKAEKKMTEEEKAQLLEIV
ncbi:response regulator, partial [Desulfobacterales bacterium HSG16]|nr:response regulator [Desulfobacterales bacterium HSG16]